MDHFNSKKLSRIFASLAQDERFAIGVSGGGDSMALLHLALNWRGGPNDIVALTVDHALRHGSAQEAQQVKRWCDDLGVEHHILKWRHEPISAGIQAKARQARYDLMSAWCLKHGCAALLTAHTLEDQAETVAMRLQRTSSTRSLAGIWPETAWNGLRIFRPLLGEKREGLRAYLVGQRQEWTEDPSNQNEKFERVRVRKSMPPLALAKRASAAQRKIIATESRAQDWCSKNLTIAASGMLSFAPARFQKLKHELADAILLRLIELAGGKAPDAARRHAFVTWLQEGVGSQVQPRRTLGGAIFAKRQRKIIVARESARIDTRPVPLAADMPVIWDGRFLVRGPRSSTIIAASTAKPLKSGAEIPAFVRKGWPLVMRGDELLATPLAQFHAAAKITFIKK